MNIKYLIGETTQYDKKQALEEKRPKSWCKSVSAFANGDGGCLIFGIADDGTVVGVTDPEHVAEKASEIIKTHLDPVPRFILRFEQLEGKTLIILEVMRGEDTPYYYSADGVLEAFVRIGNESVRATATEQRRLVMKGRNVSYDAQISPYKVGDYAFSKLHERYKKWTGKSFEERFLVSFGLANDKGYLSNAGALLADECPIRWSRIFCTRWNGLNKNSGTIDAVDDAEYEGGLIYLLENGENFILRNAHKMWRKTANSREEMFDYVERSYHEALVNALVHRDYLVNGSEVHIDMYDDRLEITSPGGMADGIPIQDRDPLTVTSTRRNPLLADVFERLGLMERKGSGFGKIISAYEFQVNYNEKKKPIFRSDRSNFAVILPNLNYNGPQGGTQDDHGGGPQGGTQDDHLGGTQDARGGGTQGGTQDALRDSIVHIINKDSRVTLQKMSEITGVSVRTLKRRISEMPAVKYIGSGYSGHWCVTENRI